jgi:hypothetical protein
VSLSAIPSALRLLVFERDEGRCRYCRLAQIGQGAVLHVNHILPKSRGGRTDPDNLVLQCPYCSLHKSNKVTALDPLTGEATELLHPLRQIWGEHFILESDGALRGNTPIGRTTIEALRMNDALPRIARAIQIRLNLLSPSAP